MTGEPERQQGPAEPPDGEYRYPDTRDQVIALLSNPEHQAWVQNVQTAYARGTLYPQAFKSIEEYDAYVASQSAE